MTPPTNVPPISVPNDEVQSLQYNRDGVYPSPHDARDLEYGRVPQQIPRTFDTSIRMMAGLRQHGMVQAFDEIRLSPPTIIPVPSRTSIASIAGSFGASGHMGTWTDRIRIPAVFVGYTGEEERL